jgi:hypothetical protein
MVGYQIIYSLVRSHAVTGEQNRIKVFVIVPFSRLKALVPDRQWIGLDFTLGIHLHRSHLIIQFR